MSYRGGHGRGGPGGMQKPRGGGGPGGMNFPNDMQQPFGYQQRSFQQQMMQQQPPGQSLQPQQMGMAPQQIQIPQNQSGSRSFMAGMPSPSIAQAGSMSMMGYQGSGSGAKLPFGPPIVPNDQGQKSHHDILRKHQEEYSLKQTGQMVMSQALSATPGSYIGMSSKYNNSVVPVLPRLANPQGH